MSVSAEVFSLEASQCLQKHAPWKLLQATAFSFLSMILSIVILWLGFSRQISINKYRSTLKQGAWRKTRKQNCANFIRAWRFDDYIYLRIIRESFTVLKDTFIAFPSNYFPEICKEILILNIK